MSKKLELERLEKVSTLIRNTLLIIGTLVAAAIFLSEKFNTDLTVKVHTFYLNGDNTVIASPSIQLGDKNAPVGKLGTLTLATVTNNSNLPVALEIRIPKSYELSDLNTEKMFTTISANPLCHLKQDEISISNNGFIDKHMVGSVEVNKFPPDCSLEVYISSTQLNKSTRFMSGKIEVFYDGKKAQIERPTLVYGMFGDYLNLVIKKGFIGFLMFVLLPILLGFFAIIWVIETLTKDKEKGEVAQKNV